MTISAKKALENAKEFCNTIIFIESDKEKIKKVLVDIYNEIEKESIAGKVNFQIYIKSNRILKIDFLKYIVINIREKGFESYVQKYNDNYIFDIRIPI